MNLQLSPTCPLFRGSTVVEILRGPAFDFHSKLSKLRNFKPRNRNIYVIPCQYHNEQSSNMKLQGFRK